VADYRTKAGECCRMAALAPRAADRATWLKLAYEWLALNQPATERLDVIKREGHSETFVGAKNASPCSCACPQTALGETYFGDRILRLHRSSHGRSAHAVRFFPR